MPRAFPSLARELTLGVAHDLRPFVDEGYKIKPTTVTSCGRPAEIPGRVSFMGLDPNRVQEPGAAGLVTLCLCSRSTDGYLRQTALQRILPSNECWVVPFVVLLSAEYVVEMACDLAAALPNLTRQPYIDFVRENRPLMRTLCDRAISYWDCYYRAEYPDRAKYPSLVFLRELEFWST